MIIRMEVQRWRLEPPYKMNGEGLLSKVLECWIDDVFTRISNIMFISPRRDHLLVGTAMYSYICKFNDEEK